MDAKTVGNQIRQCRKMKGLTQEELAKETGLSTMSIRRYESGQRIAPQKTLIKIAKALDIHLRDLSAASIWEEYDREHPNAAREFQELELFEGFLESIGYTVSFSPAGEEGESFIAELSKNGTKTVFTEAEFEDFRQETKKTVDYQVWRKSHEKK